MDLAALGIPTGPMTRVGGGFANRLYRLETDRGLFAVKEMNLADRREIYHLEQVFAFERAAFAAGIPMPEPISAHEDTVVHRWVDGDTLPEAPVPPAFAFEVGEILARLHRLSITWPDSSVEPPAPRDWPELASRATVTGQPWAGLLTSRIDTLLAIADFVDTCERPGPVVLTHKDVQPWNLLARQAKPVLLDWELSGMLDLSAELGSTALGLSKGPGFDSIEPQVFRSVLGGYRAAGGVLPPAGPSWFVHTISGWLGHTRANVLRCLSGSHPITGPDLALSQEIAGRGVRGLPELYDRLPQLAKLLT